MVMRAASILVAALPVALLVGCSSSAGASHPSTVAPVASATEPAHDGPNFSPDPTDAPPPTDAGGGTDDSAPSGDGSSGSFDASAALAQLDGNTAPASDYQAALLQITEGCGGDLDSNSDNAVKAQSILKDDGHKTDLLTIVQGVGEGVSGGAAGVTDCQSAFAAWIVLYEDAS